MSGSKYEYVRTYERPDALLANTYLLLRIDGHAFHKSVPEGLNACSRCL
jgi:tRNA(His) guanylyltransferase